MSVQKITYEDKIQLQNEEDIPNKNKVTDDDLNEIKEVVNNNADELSTAQENIENLQEGQGTAGSDITILKSKVSTLETDNTSNKENIENLQTDNVTNKQNIQNLQTDNATNKQDISSLKNRVSVLEADNTTNKQNIENLQDESHTHTNKEVLDKITQDDLDKLDELENYDDTEIKQDISDIQKKDEQQDTDIENLKSENTELKAENERLKKDIDNNIPTISGNGENITLEDTTESRFTKFEVGGNSKQETRSGKNKFNIDYLNDTVENKNAETGSFEFKNCYGQAIMSATNLIKMLKPSTSYKCIANVTLLEKPETLLNSYNYLINIYNHSALSTISILHTSTASDKDNWNVNETKKILCTFATPSDLTGYVMSAYNHKDGDGNASGSFKFENIMILEATEEDESFEQYGAMPSTEFISETKNVEDNANITVCNKNLANIEKVYQNMQAYDSSHCSEVTEDGKECIRFFNTSFRPDTDNPFNFINFKYKENTAYTIRGIFKSESIPTGGSGGIFFQIMYTDGTTLRRPLAATTSWTELRTVSNSNKTIDKIGFTYGTPVYWFLDKSSFAIIEGDTTDYIANQEQDFTFPLAQGQKLMLTDYLADDGIHHKRKQIELDGTEGWFIGTELTNTYSFGLVVDNKTATSGLCNTFKTREFGVSSIDEEFVQVNTSSTIIYVRINKNRLNTVDVAGFKEWLASRKTAGTPVIVEYGLENEEIDEYTEEQQAVYNEIKKTVHSYKDVTHIFSTDETSLIFDVEAKRDIQTQNDNLQSQIDEIKELLSTTATSALLLNNMQSDLESEVE